MVEAPSATLWWAMRMHLKLVRLIRELEFWWFACELAPDLPPPPTRHAVDKMQRSHDQLLMPRTNEAGQMPALKHTPRPADAHTHSPLDPPQLSQRTQCGLDDVMTPRDRDRQPVAAS